LNTASTIPFGRSIMCMHDGKMLGGNSAFLHLGTYRERDGEIIAEVITERHTMTIPTTSR